MIKREAEYFKKKEENILVKEASVQSSDLPLILFSVFPAEISPLPDLWHTSAELSLASLLSHKINCLRSEWVKTTQRCHYFTAIDHTLGNTSQ